MSDYNLGTARGVIEIEYKGNGPKQAAEDMRQTGKATQNARADINKAANGAGVAGAVIAGGFALAAKSAADFEFRMSAVESVSGASASQMDALRDKALQLGKDTKFSATESASAMEELVKAGLSVEDVLNGAADSTVALAAAGEIALPEAATIAANAMNQFNLGAEDMVNVADKIAGAANASAIDVSEFGQSMQQAGAVANLAGVSFDDTATAIALMGNAGIKGSDAGTSLKSMLMRLQPTTEKQATTMEDLGLLTYNLADANAALAKITGGPAQKSIAGVQGELSKYVESIGKGTQGTKKNADAVKDLMMKYGGLKNEFYDAKGNTQDLATISGKLQGALKGMTKEQKQAALTTLFGSDAIRAAAILANNGAKGFDKMATSMGKISAADVAATRMDNLKGSFEQFKGSVETLGIVIGTPLLGALRDVVDGLTSMLDAFMNLPGSVQAGIGIFLALVGTLLIAFSAFVKFVQFMQAIKAAFIAVRAVAIPAWLAALGPIALVIVAIAAVVAIIVLLWKHCETFRNIVTAVWSAVQAGAAAVAAWFTGTFLPAIVGVWNAISAAAMTVWNAIVSFISTVVNVIKTVIMTGLNIVLGVWRAVWGMFGPLVKAYFGLILAIFRLWWTVVKGLFILGVRLVKGVVMAGFNLIKTVVTTVMRAIMAVIRSVWGAIGPYVKAAVNGIKSAVTTAWNAVKNVTSTVWNALKGVVSGAIDKVVALAKGIKDRILSPLAGAGSWLYDKGKEIIEGLIGGITSMIGKVTDTIKGVTDRIAGFLPGSPVREGPLKVLNNGYAGKKIVEMVGDGIEGGIDPLEYSLRSLLAVGNVGSGLPSTIVPSTPVAASPGAVPVAAGSGGGGSRLVQGTLSIDKSGRAWITGIAEDVYDDFAGDDGRRGDMQW